MKEDKIDYLNQQYMGKFFASMTEGFAHHEIICNEDGKPIDYRFLDINLAFEKITGLSRQEVIGKTLRDIYPDISSTWIEKYGKVALTGVSVTFENYDDLLKKHFRVIAFSHQKGQFSVFFVDITDLMKANEALLKYKLLLDNSKDIIMILSSNGQIIEANLKAIASYGYSREELIKKSILDIRSPEARENFKEQFEQALLYGASFETVHMRKDGSVFPVEVSSQSAVIDEETILISIIRDISLRKQAENNLHYLANHDYLTNIPNRSYLMNNFDLVIENAKRGEYRFAFLLFDINKFKYINDTYGHDAGDQVLKEIANRVKNSIRKVDIISRIGGDEFVILQQHVKSLRDVELFIGKIFQAFEKPIDIYELKINVTTSIGVSIFPDDADNRRLLMKYSDQAMYQAKQKGGNSFEFYSRLKP